MAGFLIRLVSDMMHDDRVRRRFNAAPFAVMDEYGLSVEARGVLHKMDFQAIGDFISKEFTDEWTFPDWDLPETDPECMGVAGEYPDPKPHVDNISPDIAKKAAKSVEVIVTGEGFSRDASLAFVGDDKSVLEATELEVYGTYRCSHLKAVVDLTKATIQGYTVQVIVSPGDANELELPTSKGSPIAFTVQ